MDALSCTRQRQSTKQQRVGVSAQRGGAGEGQRGLLVTAEDARGEPEGVAHAAGEHQDFGRGFYMTTDRATAEAYGVDRNLKASAGKGAGMTLPAGGCVMPAAREQRAE